MGSSSRQCIEPAKLRGFQRDGFARSLSYNLQVRSTLFPLVLLSVHVPFCKLMLFVRLEWKGGQEVIKLNYSQTAVSNFVASVQLDLHRTGRAVSSAAVINRVCEQMGVDRYSDFGLGPPYQLQRLRRLGEIESRLVMYVSSYVANR